MTDRRDHEKLPVALQPFSRVLAIHDALPDGFKPSDETPLREILPGVWPSVSDLRALVEWAETAGAREAKLRADNNRMRERYENWKPIATPPHEAENPGSLLCFWCEPKDEDDHHWITDVWGKRPDSAVMWCFIKMPEGPHPEHFAALAPQEGH